MDFRVHFKIKFALVRKCPGHHGYNHDKKIHPYKNNRDVLKYMYLNGTSKFYISGKDSIPPLALCFSSGN